MRRKFSDISVKNGLAWLKVGWFFHHFMLIIPVIVLIYVDKGVSVGDFFLIQGLFRLAAFLFEIPSGYLSDCFSRKRVMIAGALFSLLGFTIIAVAYGFWALVLGEAMLGISSALFSGTLEAYTYDLMKRNKSQKQFLKEFGTISTFASGATFIAAILGGVLFGYIGANGILWLESLFAAIAVVALLFIPELSEIKRVVKQKSAVADAVSVTTNTLKNPKLRNLILFPSLFGAFTIVLLWIMQPIMETAHVPVGLFGFYLGINQLSAVFFAKYAYKLCEKLGEISVSIITIVAIVVGVAMGLIATHINSMPIVYIACAIMAVTPAIRMLNNLQYNTLIHHSIKSTERGTVLSTRAMTSTILGALFLIAGKFLMDGFGITVTLLFVLAMVTLLIWSLKNAAKYINKK